MHQHAYFNNVLLAAADTTIPAPSSAALYGKGVFTTIAIYNGRPFLWEKHWRRLSDNAANLGLNISEHSESNVQGSLVELLEANSVIHGRSRITFFDGSSSPVWRYESERKSSLLITTADFREMPKDFRLTISPYRVNSASPLAGIKSCNYLEKILALGEARDRGFDEAVQLNERGHVVSACLTNIFWLNAGRLYTPRLETGCVPGTTREFVMENLQCKETESGIKSIVSADAVFLTSAGLGVTQARQIDKRALPEIEHPITNMLSGFTNSAPDQSSECKL